MYLRATSAEDASRRWVLLAPRARTGREEAFWLWLVCAAQGYDQGGGADQEEGGDGGADADE